MTNPQILSTGSILEGRILLAFCVHSKTLQIFGVARNKKEKKQNFTSIGNSNIPKGVQ